VKTKESGALAVPCRLSTDCEKAGVTNAISIRTIRTQRHVLDNWIFDRIFVPTDDWRIPRSGLSPAKFFGMRRSHLTFKMFNSQR
jgi:hypothetical protein